jgi:hypothetical protein
MGQRNLPVPKTKQRSEQARETRITMEIVVDAYDAQERAMGWYCYLEDRLQFPFTAICTARRSISPLQPKDEVEVLAMADSDECPGEMFVTIRWERRGLAVPLSQLAPSPSTDEQTKQAAADWHYWVKMGYEF